MSENIIIAVLGVIASMIGSASVINWRLKQLENKVEKHNGYAEKFAENTKDIALMAQSLEWIKTSIEELKNK